MLARLMLGAIAITVGLLGREGIAAAEVPGLKVLPAPPTAEVRYGRELPVWELKVKKREGRLRAGLALAIAGGVPASVAATVLVAVAAGSAVPHREPGSGLWTSAPSDLTGVEAVTIPILAIAGALVIAGIPLIVYGANRPPRPERPAHIVYGAIRPLPSGLGFSF